MHGKIKKITSISYICINGNNVINILVSENFTALLRAESTIDAFLATL